MTLSISEVVRALNHRDDAAAYNLLAAYARANGAFFISASGVWFEPATSGSTSNGQDTGGDHA